MPSPCEYRSLVLSLVPLSHPVRCASFLLSNSHRTIWLVSAFALTTLVVATSLASVVLYQPIHILRRSPPSVVAVSRMVAVRADYHPKGKTCYFYYQGKTCYFLDPWKIHLHLELSDHTASKTRIRDLWFRTLIGVSDVRVHSPLFALFSVVALLETGLPDVS